MSPVRAEWHRWLHLPFAVRPWEGMHLPLCAAFFCTSILLGKPMSNCGLGLICRSAGYREGVLGEPEALIELLCLGSKRMRLAWNPLKQNCFLAIKQGGSFIAELDLAHSAVSPHHSSLPHASSSTLVLSEQKARMLSVLPVLGQAHPST